MNFLLELNIFNLDEYAFEATTVCYYSNKLWQILGFGLSNTPAEALDLIKGGYLRLYRIKACHLIWSRLKIQT